MNSLLKHPCYSDCAHFKYSRIHLPVAKKCNVQCNYCSRKFDKEENSPGVCERVLSPSEILSYIDRILSVVPEETTTLGIAGPGEPLFNEETFETLNAVKKKYPRLYKCIATNGILLEDKLDRLLDCEVTHVTVTVNAVNPETASKIYSWVNYGKVYTGIEAGEVVVERQMRGIVEASKAGLLIKVNTVYIPGINDSEIVDIAKAISNYAYIMNIMPLIPRGKFSNIRAPEMREVELARKVASRYIRQFHNCKLCRADAYGVPGKVY